MIEVAGWGMLAPGNRARVFVHPQGLCESDTVCDGTRVWAFAHVLPGAQVRQDCKLCDGAFVGASAVVTADVPDYGFVVGNPGRVIGWACVCRERLDQMLSCSCGRSYQKTDRGIRQVQAETSD
jgi:hypothetical protein